MSENDLPIMPFFVKDWIAATVHMTDAERGAYASLLFHQWVNGILPPDPSQLARIMGTRDEDFEKRWTALSAKFDGDQDGLFNNRLEHHRKRALELRDSKVRAADAANAVRRAKKAQRVAAANAVHVPRDVPHTDALRTHTYTSTSLKKKNQKEEEEEREKEEPLFELRTANAERASRETYRNYWSEEKWIDFKLRYPKRAGGYDWEGAKKAWRARLREGHTWEQLLDGADRYRAYCEAAGKIGTEIVMMPKTFCGPGKRFLEELELPTDAERNAAWSPPCDDPPEAA